jgi:hypothetical protein
VIARACRAPTILASREASPVEIGEEIGVGASHVAYHVRVLLKADLIELVEEVPNRGSIEHRYAAIDAHRLTDDRSLASAPQERARRVYKTFCFAVADANCALSSGQFERDHSPGGRSRPDGSHRGGGHGCAGLLHRLQAAAGEPPPRRIRLPRDAVGRTPICALLGRRPASPSTYCAFPTLVLGATSAISPIFISLTPF